MIWRCPRCHGRLEDASDGLACRSCGSSYPAFDGIPDLRVPGPSYVDTEADRVAALALLDEMGRLGTEDLVRRAFGFRREGDWMGGRVDERTRRVLECTGVLRRELRGWLRQCLEPGRAVLDAGCGLGSFLVAAAAEGVEAIGVDASLVSLLVARRRIQEGGGRAMLAAAQVEALPLADGAVAGAVSLDVLEHVSDAGRCLAELERVTAPGGFVALATPNRFGLAAEPHVLLWGVGWLPRRWQAGYVARRAGLRYHFVRLLSARELARLLGRHTRLRFGFVLPAVAEAEIARLRPARRLLARTYNAALPWRMLGGALLLLVPLLRAFGVKPATGSAARPGSR
jgi:SAM-dependent methyltransferase